MRKNRLNEVGAGIGEDRLLSVETTSVFDNRNPGLDKLALFCISERDIRVPVESNGISEFRQGNGNRARLTAIPICNGNSTLLNWQPTMSFRPEFAHAEKQSKLSLPLAYEPTFPK